jgi:hypothetical protein
MKKLLATLAIPLISSIVLAQPAPGLLPPSVTGKPIDKVTPTSAVVAKSFPIDRFKTAGQTAEAMTALDSCREAAGWLGRMSMVDGRVKAGIDATLQRELPGTDVEQAKVCLAMSRYAKFSGDDKLTAAASQLCLTLLAACKPDAKDTTMRVPGVSEADGQRVLLAAYLCMAICELPTPEAKLVAEANKLARFLYTTLRDDGSVQAGCTGERAELCAGVTFQALMVSDSVSPEEWKRAALQRGVTYYHAAFGKAKSSTLACAMLPAVVDYALRVKSEAANTFALELADDLCDRQYTTTDAKQLRWVGGLKPAKGDEPTLQTAEVAKALAAAITLCINIPDATRFQRYRTACSKAMGFVRLCQFDDNNTRHFERSFRVNYLVGSAHNSLTDGQPRAEHTASVLLCQLRFLECGGEKTADR